MRYPGATWIGPTPNSTAGGQRMVRGLVLHIMDGSESGTESWFQNRAAQASSHFLNPRSGGLRQMVDTGDRAWTQMSGNYEWLSVENEGRGGDSLTDSQIANLGALFKWVCDNYAVPMQLTNDPSGHGLGWHGMGGAAWGGHYDCPGNAVLAQRGAILAAATGHPSGGQDYTPFPGADFFYDGQSSDVITRMGKRLVEMGCSAYQVGPGPRWTVADKTSYSMWQMKCGYSGSDADGIPGPTSWDLLKVPLS